MTDRHHPTPAEHAELTDHDLAIATLVGRYIERREHHETPCAHELLRSPPNSATRPPTRCAPSLRATRRCAPTPTNRPLQP
jgi:hypothetical protein